MSKLGLYFRREKLEALLRGDVSNAVVNRYFVYAIQGIGTHLCGPPETTYAVVLLQARYAQMAWESLAEIHATDDHVLKAQTFIQLVHTFIIIGLTTGAQFYLFKIRKIIDKAKLQFLPAYGGPTELSEQVREDAVVLSQAIYLEIYFYLTLNWSTSLKMARIEKEFRLDLQVRTIQ